MWIFFFFYIRLFLKIKQFKIQILLPGGETLVQEVEESTMLSDLKVYPLKSFLFLFQ